MHLIRNAVHHGIEPAEVRLAQNKPATATINLSARREGNHIVLRFSDDGQGLDFEAIKAKARQFGLGEQVDTITSPADGLRGKPHPDIFLEAARRLGVEPARCLVFEDAPLGIEAARRGGMAAVVLTTTLPADAFAGFPNVVATIADFTDYSLPNSLDPESSHA